MGKSYPNDLFAARVDVLVVVLVVVTLVLVIICSHLVFIRGRNGYKATSVLPAAICEVPMNLGSSKFNMK